MSESASIEKYWTNKLNRSGKGVIAQRLEKEPFKFSADNIAVVKARLRKNKKRNSFFSESMVEDSVE